MLYDEPDLYDAHYIGYRDDLPFYTRLAADTGSPVLELGAGTGRVTEALALAGHEVLAVDLSPAMLATAEARLGRAGVMDRVRLLEADMRSLRLKERFPLVIAPFNALMHAYTLDDQDRTLDVVRQHLEDGGVFAFDLYVPNFGPEGVLRREPDFRGRQPGEGVLREDVLFVQEMDRTAQLVTTTYFHDAVTRDGSLRRRVTELRQRYYTRFEVERLCRAGGFRLRVYGDFDRSRYGEGSPLMVCLARHERAA